jgi:hypothetical protein
LSGQPFQELTAVQRHTYQAALEIYQALLEALRQDRPLKGGMHWKKIRGREYLYRYYDRYGHGQSLGPRSDATEQRFAEFTRQRQEVGAQLRGLRLQLREQARFCRAALIHRVPQATAKILRHMEHHELGPQLLVIGTTALYAYEFAAGVFCTGPEPANLLENSRRRLTLAGTGKVPAADFLDLLRQGDRSFALLPGEDCRAVNREGFLVQVLKSGERRAGKYRAVTVPGAREPLPPDAGQLQFLAAAAKFAQIVIGQDGGPATMVVPDPWAFALNRLWWSRQEDREAATRTRDRHQALAVAGLVLSYLPQYDFSPSELDMFPQELVHQLERSAEGAELPDPLDFA